MPRYFFHLHNDIDVTDDEGRELADESAARSAAHDDARQMAGESVQHGHLNLDHFIEVADDEGRPLFRVTFREVVTIEG